MRVSRVGLKSWVPKLGNDWTRYPILGTIKKTETQLPPTKPRQKGKKVKKCPEVLKQFFKDAIIFLPAALFFIPTTDTFPSILNFALSTSSEFVE